MSLDLAEMIAKSPEASGQTTAADLCAMFRDPRYWRDRDPEFCAKASEAFRKLVEG